MNKFTTRFTHTLIAPLLLSVSASLYAEAPTLELKPSHWFHQDKAKDLTPDSIRHYTPFTLEADTSGHQIRLLKKTADWNQQHTNGITIKLAPSDIWQHNPILRLSFLIDPTHTSLPSKTQLKDSYNKIFTVKKLENFDDKNAHLLITLWGKTDADKGRRRIDYTLSIAPIDWGKLRAYSLPLADFICSYEVNYQREIVTHNNKCARENWQELTLVNENRDKNVLRNLQRSAFDERTTPELYRIVQLNQLQLALTAASTKD